MNTRKHLMGWLTASLLGATALSAQAPRPFDAGLNLVAGLPALTSLTHASGLGGFTAEAGYNGLVKGSTVPFRLSASLNDLPGKEAAFVKSDLLGLQLAADISTDIGLRKVVMVSGLSLNTWRWTYQDATQKTEARMKGAKLGARFGFDIRLSERLTGSLLLQMTELGTDKLSSRGYNPSWLQAGARYRF